MGEAKRVGQGGKEMRAERYRIIGKLYQQGLTGAVIAQRVGMTEHHVRAILRSLREEQKIV